MTNNMSESPHNCVIFLILINKVPHSSVDLLDDAITEVYDPSLKRWRMEDMIAEETVEQSEVGCGSSKLLRWSNLLSS
jgi:hypothetical protein